MAHKAANSQRIGLVQFPNGHGSCFHYGGGWMITNSHVVGGNAQDLPLSKISFPNGAICNPKLRHCFLFHITNPTTLLADMDFAIFCDKSDNGVDLPHGILEGQYKSYDPLNFNLGDHNVAQGAALYCYHFGGTLPVVTNPSLSNNELVSTVSQIDNTAPVIITRTNFSTVGGSSGSAVYRQDNDKLIGLHFATGKALRFVPDISTILNNLILSFSGLVHLDSVVDIIYDPTIDQGIRTTAQQNLKRMLERMENPGSWSGLLITKGGVQISFQ